MYDGPYNKPANFGLTIVDEQNEHDLFYEFNTAVLFKHEDGRFFFAHDSGCSCPSPFENYNSLADLAEIENVAGLRAELDNWLRVGEQDSDKEAMVSEYLKAGGKH